MNTKISRTAVLLFCLVSLGASNCSCARKGPVKVDSGHQIVMGTFARVVVVAESREAGLDCIQAAMAEVHKVDELMSDYKDDSDIGRVNEKAAEIPVPVSEWTFDVLKRSVEFSRLTDGAFDVTVGPLMDLFREAKKGAAAPTEQQIAEAKSKVGFEKLKLDGQNRTVQFAVEGMRLDLGGIAKGYAIDKAVEAAQQHGAIGGMVDIGGDIRCFGSPPEGRENWLIAVQNPDATVEHTSGGQLLLTLKVTDTAVTTSGDYRQYVMIGGLRRSHIMNSQTGSSAEGLSSVTIIADNATDADALATSVSVMGAEKGLALIEEQPNVEAILISSGPEYKVTKTSGAKRHVKQD